MIYPGPDIEKAADRNDCSARKRPVPRALISAVLPDSPAWDAGFEPGCFLTSVNGHPLRDIIDWRWHSAEDEMTVGYVDLDGEEGEVELFREEGEDWGFRFDGVLFDNVKLCRNACVFCFMRQLPDHMRPSLSLRDDDFRLSFLSGTFVTLTNLSPEDEARIIEQRISPLRVSLHAAEPDLRLHMIGRHAAHGLAALERLLAAGIEAHAQIVLMPGMNDGEHLQKTLEWAYERPGIKNVGIVPLGFTKHQTALHSSFTTPEAALAVLETVAPFQERARRERGGPWVFGADEFYANAYGAETPQRIPPASDYGDYEMFEDGIGIIRSFVDEFNEACENGLAQRASDVLASRAMTARYVIGQAMQPFFDEMVARSPLAGRFAPLTVENRYFGGNVNVTGLLTAEDIVDAVRRARSCNSPSHNPEQEQEGPGCPHRASSARAESAGGAFVRAQDCLSEWGCPGPSQPGEPQPELETKDLFLLPKVIFNDNGVTLDDATVQDMENAAGASLHVVSCNPLSYLEEIIAIIEGRL